MAEPSMPEPDSDAALIVAFAEGRSAALGALAERHERSMLGVALGLLDGRRELAREAVQDAWVRVIRHARRFDARGSAQGWLLRIVVNCARDIRKREARENGRARSSSRYAGGAADDPRGSLAEQDAAMALRLAVARLDDAKREALLLSHHRGLPLEVVAEIVGAPLGTVKSRVHAAKAALRAALEAEVSS